MFVCHFEGFFGMGETILGSFEAMVENMELSVDDDSPEPFYCDFFQHMLVEVRETKTWDIQESEE